MYVREDPYTHVTHACRKVRVMCVVFDVNAVWKATCVAYA